MSTVVPEDRGSDAALALFEAFLERHHSGGADLDALCAAHPEHADRFRRWWGHLSAVGEVGLAEAGADAEPEAGDRFGAYRILRELGRGAQGTVYLAEDTRLPRRVALKVLPLRCIHGRDPGARFAREAELASRLDHPGLCTVFERGVHGSTALLAMRLCDGETVAAAIARARRGADAGARVTAVRLAADADAGVDERAAIQRLLVVFEKVARALHAAHEARLVHRDVKPGNLMVDTRGEPVLLDFGLARDLEDGSEALTRTGDTVGTPAYMAPEQLEGGVEVDRRADVYALAATLYECLTLHRPHEAATRAELYRRIADVAPLRARRRNPAVPRDLDTVLDTALQKAPAARYRTAEDFAEDLRRVACREPILARPAGPLVRGWRWAQRNPGVAASVAAVFVSLAGGLGVSLWLQAETARARAEEQRLLARLTDDVRLDDAERAAVALFPIGADDADALAAWLATFGEPLAAALPDHRAQLDALRRRALPDDPAATARARAEHPAMDELRRLRAELESSRARLDEPDLRPVVRPRLELFAAALAERVAALERTVAAHRPYRFAAPSQQALHDGLSELVERLEVFAGPDGMLARMRAHHGWASTARARIDGPLAAAWRAATEYAARTDGPYAGRVLAPQPGLVPLGPDPRSGLLEFAFDRGGTIPSRDPARGELALDVDSALVFVLVPGGRYRLGRLEHALSVDERFERDVDLDWFAILKHEVSRAQWRALTGRAPPDDLLSTFGFDIGDDHPVDFVSWHEARDALAEFGLDLPTEAQWECAAAGGTRTRWWWGDGPPPRDGLWANLRDRSFARAVGAGGVAYDDSHAVTAPVHAPFQPNPFGLCAVHGNVAEWCRDAYLPRTPLDRFEVRPGDGLHRVPALGAFAVRGGRYDTRGPETAVSARAGLRGAVGYTGLGLRPVVPIR